jgi:AraC-like DNA-binding protein
MTDSAMNAGFGSYAQFFRAFTALMGCTPATYLRQGPHQHEDMLVVTLPFSSFPISDTLLDRRVLDAYPRLTDLLRLDC